MNAAPEGRAANPPTLPDSHRKDADDADFEVRPRIPERA